MKYCQQNLNSNMALSPKEQSKNMANCSGVFALAFIFLRCFKITILEDDWWKLLCEYKCYLMCMNANRCMNAFKLSGKQDLVQK